MNSFDALPNIIFPISYALRIFNSRYTDDFRNKYFEAVYSMFGMFSLLNRDPTHFSYTKCTLYTDVACQPFPTWLNIETTALSPVFGDTVSYICKTSYHFPDSAQYKDNSCDDNGDWVQEFYTCSCKCIQLY